MTSRLPNGVLRSRNDAVVEPYIWSSDWDIETRAERNEDKIAYEREKDISARPRTYQDHEINELAYMLENEAYITYEQFMEEVYAEQAGQQALDAKRGK